MTESFINLFINTFISGGILMYPLAILAFYLYFSAFKIFFQLRGKARLCANKKEFKTAYNSFFSDSENKDIKQNFTLLRLKFLAGSDGKLLTLKILSSVAPLIGLLGTVCGMSLSIASTGTNSSGIADGISSALITTQAGLVIAIPAWIITMLAVAQKQTLLIALARREAELIREIVK